MRFCDQMYFGDKAEKNRERILDGLRAGKLLPEVYVITPPMSGNIMFEIYPYAQLLLPPYCGRNWLIAGVAVTYWEALEVVRRMVDDMQKQGELC